jgi:hypothetical protein
MKNPQDLWVACERMEITATIALSEQLALFELPISKCYEAGVQAPTLPGKRHQESDILLSGLFLKKALNDLRAIWVLLRLGYTSQAASVAASLYENTLAATCLAGDLTNARKFQKSGRGDLPWSPQQLAKMLARRWQKEAHSVGKQFDQEEYQRAWREIYSAYKWLCKIKHPTLRSAGHDALAASVKDGEYVIMAAPDLRPEDFPVKATILTIAVNRVREAIRSFTLALECDDSHSVCKEFKSRMTEVLSGLKTAYEVPMRPLPFDIRDTSLAQD